MPDYYVLRKTKWFYNIGAGQPGDSVLATYRGSDSLGNPDPKAGPPDGGIPGKRYTVILMSGTKLYAPCPDFCNGGEAPKLNDVDRAIMRVVALCGKTNSRFGVKRARKNAVRGRSGNAKRSTKSLGKKRAKRNQ
ncbi:MAG: hypothetical protein ACHQ1D_03840 [Nitrososphaerales archaeon]